MRSKGDDEQKAHSKSLININCFMASITITIIPTTILTSISQKGFPPHPYFSKFGLSGKHSSHQLACPNLSLFQKSSQNLDLEATSVGTSYQTLANFHREKRKGSSQ